MKSLDCIPHCVSKMQNKMLCAEVTKEEVKSVPWGLGKDRSPGLDGFTRSIFIYFWDCLGMKYGRWSRNLDKEGLF